MEKNMSAASVREKYTWKQVVRCVVPSCCGIFLFLVPVPYQGSLTIPVTLVLNKVNDLLGYELLLWGAYVTIMIAAIFSFIGSVLKPKFMINNEILNSTFNLQWYWVAIRVLGGVLASMVIFGIGPEMVLSPDTGTFVLCDLISGILPIGFVSGAVLPLLIEFGVMEYVGTFMGRFFRRCFLIPGRSAIDCLASWIGANGIGVLMTENQYENGYYNAREACVISTTFSAVTITFALVIIEQVGFMDMFFPFYGTVCLVGIACAVIMPRIPPLSRKNNDFYPGVTPRVQEDMAAGYTLAGWAAHLAIQRATKNGYTFKSYLRDWLKASCTMVFVLNTTVMAVGTISLIVAYYTPIMNWLGLPFLPLLQLLQVPEAQAASGTMFAGFADMFIPAVLAAGTISSPFTRFLVAVVSITQLIFISETGSMILGSKIPVNFWDLLVIFIERTVISLVFATLIIRFILQIPLV